MEKKGFKLFGIVKRPGHLNMDELKEWWLTEHAPKVAKWPGLVRYSVNLSVDDDSDFDGLAEIWFESREAMDNVFNTPEGQIAKRSAQSGSGTLVLLKTEEFCIVDKLN